MAGRECYHCKQWIEAGEPHDCWTTTETALTADLSEDLRDAWERLRETAAEFGEQRIYASHHSIMFSRNSCYFFVRPKKSHLELVVFLGRSVKASQIRRVEETSKTKRAHFIRITHRDEVEAPITDWLREAYDLGGASGLSTLNKDQIAERGARMARRDDREYRQYLREEQRSQPGCPAREVVLDQRGQATSPAAAPRSGRRRSRAVRAGKPLRKRPQASRK